MRKLMKKILRILLPGNPRDWEETNRILAAQAIILSEIWRSAPDFSNPFWIQKKEFRAYSQFGDDGIIQWLIYALNIDQGSFIEFGIGDYYESNIHFLLINNRFAGFVMDGSKTNIDTVRSSSMYWRYKLNAVQHFVTRDNINDLLKESGFEKIELLHIDLDGNDYYVLDSIDLSHLDPDILVLEYNSAFGKDRAITIPYNPNFHRINAHYSGKYFGASLLCFNDLAVKKGYYFIGCNSAGNNAYFLAIRHCTKIPKTDIYDGFQETGYREARDRQGNLSFLQINDELDLIRGLDVIDTRASRYTKI